MAFGASSKPVLKKRGRGCMGCGCGLLLLLLLLIALSIFGIYHSALGLTDTAATPVPQADRGPAVYATAQHKIDDFQQAIMHANPATLRLNSDEINTYIAREPSMASARGHLFVKLQGNEATLQSSLPVSAFEKVVMADRYTDGTATLSLAFDPQTKSITVDLHDLSVKGQSVPPSANAMLNQTLNNVLATQIQANAPLRDFLSRTQKIAIENGELVIETK
jgi:hypothetical protein